MPIKVKCPNADCGKVAAVKDEFAGKRAKCPACGTIMTIPSASGVAAPAAAAAPARRPAPPPPADEGFEAPQPAPKRRAAAPPPVEEAYEEGAEQWAGAPARKSGLVTAIAIINFVLGGLALMCGLIGLVAASMFTGASAVIATTSPMLTMQIGQGQPGMPKGMEMPKIDMGDLQRKMQEELDKQMRNDPQFKKTRAAASGALALVGTLILILSVLNILWGGGAIAGGVGLLKRRNWGRLLTLVLAGIAGVVGIGYLVTMFMGAPAMSAIPSFVIYAAYAGFVFFVLLKPDVRREFA